MIKYRATLWNKIEKIEIEKETDKSIWRKGTRCGKEKLIRESKEGWRGTIFNTWPDAREHLIATALKNISHAEDNLKIEKETYMDIMKIETIE